MLNQKLIEELRTKEELIKYFYENGIKITEKQIEALKQKYNHPKKHDKNLTIQQLKDIAGGVVGFEENFGKLTPCEVMTHKTLKSKSIAIFDCYHNIIRKVNISKFSSTDLKSLQDFIQNLPEINKDLCKSPGLAYNVSSSRFLTKTDIENELNSRDKDKNKEIAFNSFLGVICLSIVGSIATAGILGAKNNS